MNEEIGNWWLLVEAVAFVEGREKKRGSEWYSVHRVIMIDSV